MAAASSVAEEIAALRGTRPATLKDLLTLAQQTGTLHLALRGSDADRPADSRP